MIDEIDCEECVTDERDPSDVFREEQEYRIMAEANGWDLSMRRKGVDISGIKIRGANSRGHDDVTDKTNQTA